ncbi:MAG: glycosyltransferase family 4 protein [Alphaproteobacteria bacterium]
MRILQIHNYYRDRGGEDIVADAEAARLAAAGHVVERFLVHNDDIRGLAGAATTALLGPFNPLAQTRLARRLTDFRPDVAHVHNVFPRLSPAIFRTLRHHHVPSVLTLHNFRIVCPTAVLWHKGRACERSIGRSTFWAIRQRAYRGSAFATASLVAMIELHKRLGTWSRDVDAFIALTPFARETFIRAGLPAERIHVRGNATEDPGEPAATTPRTGALYAGRLSPEKGITVLLEAAHASRQPLTIVGDGPLRTACEAAARETPSITLTGRLPPAEVARHMRQAAVLVLPSVCHEMFPMALAEAFANGLPVIASRLGALESLVEEGRTGLLFEPGNPRDLADRLAWAHAHPREMEEMGRNARACYQAHFTPEVIDSRLMHVYATAIARNNLRTAPPG